MGAEKIAYSDQDRANIFVAQQEALAHVFNVIDLSKIAFVGGVADYINLRSYYDMPVHDLDILYEKEEHLKPIIENEGVIRHFSPFYKMSKGKVLVSEFFTNGKRVHTDYFKRNFYELRLTQSPLLGTLVWHASFKEMKKFHNEQIPELTSGTMGRDYEWKRLYKHSRKASLYNNVGYLKEKEQLQTLNENE